ncbi:ClbS/DfsB family four-helix bundle protein [Litoreibacter halocynthiae]|uniref:ClbS/DfsB family four-helix bundle protein n=1 Tax=Litoreibacter halocynthiae TaxID=1242689 RepID=UPI00249211B7|nr:ClbS/DfsB family four-helix bundle protein [Litoreibacter halocynthiae]
MPAATDKAALLAVTEKEYEKLEKLIVVLDADQAAAGEDGTSIKDVIGHRAHWIALFLGWYGDGQAGKPVFFPAEGYKWNDLKRYNADLQMRQARLRWGEVRALLADRKHALVGLIGSLSEDQLYGGPMKGANNAWTTGRWAEAAGASHFRSAAKFIRAALRTG